MYTIYIDIYKYTHIYIWEEVVVVVEVGRDGGGRDGDGEIVMLS